MHTPPHPAHLAVLTQRGHSQSPSSAAQLRCCCCQSLAWRPGHWCQGAAHCPECSVLCGHPSGSEAGVPVWTQCSAKRGKGSCHLLDPQKCRALLPTNQTQHIYLGRCYKSALLELPNIGLAFFTLYLPTQEASVVASLSGGGLDPPTSEPGDRRQTQRVLA